MEYHYLYQIVSLVPDENGVCKIYSGIRKSRKPPEQDKYFGSGNRLKNAVETHGRDKFIKTIVATFTTRKEAFDCETQWLDKLFYKFYGGCWEKFKKFHYNLRLNMDSRDGGSISDETRQRMSENHADFSGEKHGMWGMGHLVSGERSGVFGMGHLYTGVCNNNFKGFSVGINRTTSEVVVFDGNKTMKERGFNSAHVVACIGEKRPHHKNFTFTRTTDENYLRQLLAEDNFFDEQSKTIIQNFLQ